MMVTNLADMKGLKKKARSQVEKSSASEHKELGFPFKSEADKSKLGSNRSKKKEEVL